MKENMTIRLVSEEEMEEVRQLAAICFDYPYEKKDTAEETNQSGTEGGQTPQEQAAQEHEEIQQEGDGQKSGNPPVQPRKDRQYGAFTESGELMASMAAIPLSFYYEGKAFTGFGVGGVSTYPHHRKKGAIRTMFEQMLRDAYDEGRLLSYLYPFSESFYGRFGYCRMNNSTGYSFDLRGIPDKIWEGKFELYQKGREEVMDACKEAYEEFAVRFGLMVKREEPDWNILKDAKAWENNNYLYLYRDHAGKPAGYIVFKRKGGDLDCREFIFRDYETLCDMLAFMKGYASDYRNICFHAPSVLRLESMCKDFVAYPCRIERAMNGMVRVVNVRKALMNTVYRGSGEIAIYVTDPQIPENNGIFRVAFKDGRAQTVLFNGAEECQEESCDVSMDIAVFSAALMGDFDAADLDYLPRVKVREREICGQVFYRRPSFINNYF